MNSTTSTPNPIIFDLIALTKPRVNFLIIFTAIVGMLLAQDFNLNYSLMIYASIGIYLAASAAAVINQIVDQIFHIYNMSHIQLIYMVNLYSS